jgi:signal transduction histidine kinase/ActR/RegA family two-component response regulator
MTGWYQRLPIHGKLVALACVIAGTAVAGAVIALVAMDVWRYRSDARVDTAMMAQMLADNSIAAVAFGDVNDATSTLASAQRRRAIVRACLYLESGELFADYHRADASPCPAADAVQSSLTMMEARAAIEANGRHYGTIVVDRDLSDWGARFGVAAFAALLVLALASAAVYALAHRLQASISQPIVALADSVRAFWRPAADVPPRLAGVDEIADLRQAFDEMKGRVERADADVHASLAREREAGRLKDEFLASVSHELRTPLNAISGWAQVLSRQPADDPAQAHALSRILSNVQAQAQVIDDLIDVSRIVTGKLRLSAAPVDLRDVAGRAIDAVHTTAEIKHVTLIVQVPDAPCVVMGDAQRLEQILWNLLCNAIKFTPRDGTVTLSLRRDGEQIVCSVRDTGAGMSPEFLPVAFDRFRQEDGSITRRHGGLGLGLAIVKELTEMHAGTIAAESDGPGSGATFTLRIPASDAEIATPAPAGAATPSVAGVRVLAVDDNADATALMSDTLQRAGAHVDAVLSPLAALEKLRANDYDVIVCDLAMPEMSGIDLLKRLQSARGPSRAVPAIAVSACVSDTDRAASAAAGFTQHIGKPYEAIELIEAVASAVTGVRTPQ